MANNQTFDSIIEANSSITEDWMGGYKLELNIKALDHASDWKLDFQLPYEISEVYGVDLIDNGNGNYTVSGQNEQVNLYQGQSINSVLIINDWGQDAVEPGFEFALASSNKILAPSSDGRIISVENDFAGSIKDAIV